MKTFYMNEDEQELIHRVFGGVKILDDSVQSINTGGGVINDLYTTACGHYVSVFEDGSAYFETLEAYHNGDYVLNFVWDTPLDTMDEHAAKPQNVNEYFFAASGLTEYHLFKNIDNLDDIHMEELRELNADSHVGSEAISLIDAAKYLMDLSLDTKCVDWYQVYTQIQIYLFS